jgi:hypothetical protein
LCLEQNAQAVTHDGVIVCQKDLDHGTPLVDITENRQRNRMDAKSAVHLIKLPRERAAGCGEALIATVGRLRSCRRATAGTPKPESRRRDPLPRPAGRLALLTLLEQGRVRRVSKEVTMKRNFPLVAIVTPDARAVVAWHYAPSLDTCGL